MKSLANKAVSAAYNKLGRINDLLNGPDPRFVSYRENGKDKKIEHLDLNAEHCHSYIGKMKIDGTGTYSDEVITALIKYFFDHTKKGEKVVIELANKVSELLNGEDSMEDHMNFEEQKEHILELAKSLNKKRTKDLEIIDIQDTNKRLFSVLENQGISGLEGSGKLDFSGKFDSLDIAKYLYHVAKNDPIYLEEIKGLKSESFNGDNKDSDYYGLVEMAIRINAFLQGITLQGGVARQKKYDALLLKHINPYVKEFPGLADFQQFCRDYLKGETFKGLYFDTQESEKLVEKIDKKKQLQSKTRNALLLVLGLTVGMGATYITGKYFEKQKQKAMTEETIKDIFENKDVSIYGDMYGVTYKTPKEKLEQIQSFKDHITEAFIIRFMDEKTLKEWLSGEEKYGKLTKEQFENLVIGSMGSQKALDILANGNDMERYSKVIDQFLLSSQNKGILAQSGVDIIPYQRYKKYEQVFINSMNLPNELKNRDISFSVPKQIGVYEDLDGRSYAIGITTIHGKQYLAKGGHVYKGEISESQKDDRSLSPGQDIAFDYFLQTKPIINTIIDEFMIRYQGLEELNSRHIDGSRNKNRISRHIKEALIAHIINHKAYTIDKKDFQKISELVDAFAKKNVLDKDSSLEPYSYFDQYEEAFKNSIHQGFLISIDFSINKSFRSMNEDDNLYENKYIGKYRNQEGKMYKLLLVYAKGVPYIFANDLEQTWSKEYYLVDGDRVAKDFFEFRNKTKKAKEVEKSALKEKDNNLKSKSFLDIGLPGQDTTKFSLEAPNKK